MTTTHTATRSFADSLGDVNGFDEIAIAQQFGAKIEGLGKMDTVRALVFTDRRWNHAASDADAYKYAMNLTMRELKDYFPKETPAEIAQLEADALGEAARA